MGPMLVEEFVGDVHPHARLPLELKLYMFNDRVGAIVLMNRSSAKGQTRMRFYTDSWKPFSDPMHRSYPVADPVPAPRWLPELLRAGKRLGQAYGTFVRVDFLVAGDRVVFGEFSTHQGRGWTAFADEHLGRLWQETFPGAL